MRIAAIIAEYNPFHNGHAYQIKALREQGYTHIIAIMSPDYVERGEPAFIEKRLRARAAILNGVDLVIELPLPYALSSAQRFAYGGVALVNAIGCIESLSFGVESDSISLLKDVAFAIDSPEVESALKLNLSQGHTFAKARQIAIEQKCGSDSAKILASPNNILAVEYIRQLIKTNSAVQPHPLLRVAVEHDSQLTSASFASATYLRQIGLQDDVDTLCRFVPESAARIYKSAFEEGFAPSSLLLGERAILARLRSLPKDSFLNLPDLSEGIENRLIQALRSSCSIEELYFAVKTKRYTLSRVRRLVLSAFLGIPGFMCLESPPYLRVLGFSKSGSKILNLMKESAHLPVSASLANLAKASPKAAKFAELESSAADLYSLFLPNIKPCGLDYTTPADFNLCRRDAC